MPELPKTYKAAVYDKPGEVSTEVRDLDMPVPGAGEILVKLYVSYLFWVGGIYLWGLLC